MLRKSPKQRTYCLQLNLLLNNFGAPVICVYWRVENKHVADSEGKKNTDLPEFLTA